jgi:hypothetical protein
MEAAEAMIRLEVSRWGLIRLIALLSRDDEATSPL